jgi:hypothetical protein
MAAGGDAYREWLDTMPESLAESRTAEALRAICDYDLTKLSDLVPPRGYGRD